MHQDLNKPGRKGAISSVAAKVGVHRNTVRRILQGHPARGLNAAAVIRAAQEVIAELEEQERLVIETINQKIERHQKRIEGLREQTAA